MWCATRPSFSSLSSTTTGNTRFTPRRAEMEFLDINLSTKDSSFLLCAVHSPVYRRTLKITILFSGFMLHDSTTLLEKKCRLTYNLAAFCLKFRGSPALLVARPVFAASWNHVLWSTLSIPLTILNVCSISAWCLLSSRVGNPSFSILS